jgi:hypothetical protein
VKKTRKQQHPRLTRLLVVLGLIMAMIGFTPLLPATPVHAEPTESVEVGMPFTGPWAYNVQTSAACGSNSGQTSHPSCHENYYGNWGTDLYGTDGTHTYLQFGIASGAVSYSFVPVSDGSCGHRVVVQVSVDGVDVGSVYFDHLKNEANSTSDITNNGGKVGEIDQTCHVGFAHTHFELKNSSGYACYFNKSTSSYTAGMSVSSGSAIGKLGQTGASGNKQECTNGGNPGSSTKSDIVVHNTDNTWVVADSNGSSFMGFGTGLSGWGKGDWTGLADVTGDGKADVVLHNPDNNTYAVAVGYGNGNFGASGTGTWLSGWGAGDWVGLADITGDGKADIVIHSADNSWSVATSTGSSFSGYGNSSALAGWGKGDWTGLADVTGDGKADVVIHNPSNNTFVVSVSQGNGNFGASGTGTWLSGWGAGDWVGIGNINNDTKADIVVHNTDNTWSVATANSNGNGFDGYGNGLSGWGKGDWTGLADVTGDGKADIVVHNPASNTFAVAVGYGNGSFGASGTGTWLSGWGAGDWVGLANVK